MKSVGASPAVAPENGGFPHPAAGQAVRLVRASHQACGQTTLIRVPRALPLRAIRLVTCGHCGQEFECGSVAELGVLSSARRSGGDQAKPSARLAGAPAAYSGLDAPKSTPIGALRARRLSRLGGGSLPAIPSWVGVPVALAAVVGGLLLIQGGGSSTPPPQQASTPAPSGAAPQSPAAAPAAPAGGTAAAKATGEARLIRGTNYTIALPSGWKETTPSGGATFSASAADGSADATLWIRNDPKLDFPTFEASSLAQLRTLAGSAHVASRVTTPTPEGTTVRLAADSPAGEPAYSATLRVSGPYRYYLSTTVQPGAPDAATKGVELLSNSLTPVAGADSVGGSR
jgi:hypothetical protein